ncbi:SLOG family protein [Microcoleus sp. Pol10D4]|uniref:SLOG family protein n=1 Tax=Microcoleus sp. Pol10D4 TaxID=3055387 RepID=UPI002FD4CB6D
MATNVFALAQHIDQSLNRETQYDFSEYSELFEPKEYHTAMITGHRWISQSYKPYIDKLIMMAVNQGVKKFFCGMALGADQVAAEVLIYRKLNWTAVIPCADQHVLWKRRQQTHYKKLLAQATEHVCLYKNYSPGVMQARNSWMVKRSDICLAVFSGDPHGVGGGTATTFNMAKQKNLLIYQYVPAERKYLIIEPSYHQLRLF